MWILGVELRSSGLLGRQLTDWLYSPPSPYFLFLFLKLKTPNCVYIYKRMHVWVVGNEECSVVLLSSPYLLPIQKPPGFDTIIMLDKFSKWKYKVSSRLNFREAASNFKPYLYSNYLLCEIQI